MLPLSGPVHPIPDRVQSCHASAVFLLLRFIKGAQETHRCHHLSISRSLQPAGPTEVAFHPPPNASTSTRETDKKRKQEVAENDDHDVSDTHARFPKNFHANKHLVTSSRNVMQDY